jgi:pimeloyl-ACP methyl ester carboxylesterase
MLLVAKTYWGGAPFNFRQEPEGAKVAPLLLDTADHRQIQGLYWTPAGSPVPRVAVVCMHPRVDFTRHYSFPRLLAAGIGCLGANTRNPNNDTDTVHEQIILDVGACVAFLRDLGVRHVVLLGNSGGGSLNALYQAEAVQAPSLRLKTTPAGASTRLESYALSPADGLIYISAHKGEGRIINQCIDPAVVDELDALATDPALDMYSPSNGFRPAPEWSEYSPDFVERYRNAQLNRVARIDETARKLVEDAASAEDLHADEGFTRLGHEEQRQILLREAFEPVLVVYRTMANLHYTDNHLDPSDREYGSLLSDRPDLMNMALMGFGRICTPRAWLSTWSGLSSNADLTLTLPRIEDPTLVINAGRDREIYPDEDAGPIFSAVASDDRTFQTFPAARHYFEPDFGAAEAPDVEALMDCVVGWIQARFA